MGKPRAILYEDVDNSDVWAKINAITGAGAPAREGTSIDLTPVSDVDRAKIDKLLEKDAKENN